MALFFPHFFSVELKSGWLARLIFISSGLAERCTSASVITDKLQYRLCPAAKVDLEGFLLTSSQSQLE